MELDPPEVVRMVRSKSRRRLWHSIHNCLRQQGSTSELPMMVVICGILQDLLLHHLSIIPITHLRMEQDRSQNSTRKERSEGLENNIDLLGSALFASALTRVLLQQGAGCCPK
uniref:Uncharacterized protein n=1 Tax=Anopheles minimus TaxID=112268 RepID=A0A182VPV6_9DIPT